MPVVGFAYIDRKEYYMGLARAAIAAALSAWPGAKSYTGYDGDKRFLTVTLTVEVDNVRSD